MSDESGHGRSVAAAIGEPQGRLAWPEDIERFFHRAIGDCFSMWPRLHLSGRRHWFWRHEERLPDVDVFERKGQIVMRAEAIRASYRNGVLELMISRSSAPETKMITLQAEERHDTFR